MAFPQDIPLPKHVLTRRQQRIRELSQATLRAMGLRGLLIAVEMAGFYLFSSHALLVDALSSCFDLCSSFILLACLQFAKTPPDENHPFGHGRLEPVCGLIMGIFLVQIGLYLIYSQGIAMGHVNGNIDVRACLFALVAALLMECSHQLLGKYAKAHHSTALAAEAAHYRIDALNSIIALIAIISASFFPFYGAFIDRIGAIGIAISMVYLGFKVSKQNFDQLVDRKPSDERFLLIRHAALQVQGVLDTEKIRVQHYGPDAHVDIDVEVDPTLSVEHAHRISQIVRRSIQAQWPDVRDVTVHIEPHYEGDHPSALKK